MKTDRELLELAAKAAGIGPVLGFAENALLIGPIMRQRCWNSFVDDGDALRLAAKLRISVSQDIFQVGVFTIDLVLAGIFIKEGCTNQDRSTATRRAITRAAAAIGEGMG